MPDPFAPTPCRDCGQELPYKVHQAASLLFDGYQMDPRRLAEEVVSGLKRRAKTDAFRADLNARYPSLPPQAPITEREIGEDAVSSWVFGDFEAEHLVAAVQHYHDLDNDDGSECDRAQYAKWCHEPTPGHGGWEDRRPPECTLDAGHEGAHYFAYGAVEAVP